MNLTIRPVRVPEDLGRLVDIYNAISPDPATVEHWLGHEANPPEGRIREWVVAATEADHVVGFAGAERNSGMKEGVFFCHLRIDPSHRNQGAGTSLLRHIEAWAIGRGATQLRHAVWEIHPESLAVAQRRGYAIQRHTFVSTLDLAGFDEARFAGVIEQVEAAGIQFCSLAERHDGAIEQQLYEVDRLAQQDIPGYDRQSFTPFDRWRRDMLEGDSFRPDLLLYALAGERVVAMTQLAQRSGGLHSMMTGVLPEFRGRQLALALKLLGVRKAQAYGAAVMTTNNDSENAPMLAVNRKMGYVPGPGIYLVSRQV